MKKFNVVVNGIEYAVYAQDEKSARRIASQMGTNSARANAEKHGKRISK